MKIMITILARCLLTGCGAYEAYQQMKPKALTPPEAIGEFQRAAAIPASGITGLTAYRTSADHFGDYSVVMTLGITSNRLATLPNEVIQGWSATNKWSTISEPFDLARRNSGLRGQTNWVVPAGARLLEHWGPGDRHKIMGIDETNRVVYFYSCTW